MNLGYLKHEVFLLFIHVVMMDYGITRQRMFGEDFDKTVVTMQCQVGIKMFVRKVETDEIILIHRPWLICYSGFLWHESDSDDTVFKHS